MQTVKLKYGPSGHASPTHPDAPVGRRGEVRTVAIVDVPAAVPMAEVARLYNASIDLGADEVPFAALGVGRIIRPRED
jgi:hypothetical protein